MSALEKRYQVVKLEDPKEKHKDCQFFVLDLTHDRDARAAALAYATRIDDRELLRELAELHQKIETPVIPTPDQSWCDVGDCQRCSGYTEDESDPESCMHDCHDLDEKVARR